MATTRVMPADALIQACMDLEFGRIVLAVILVVWAVSKLARPALAFLIVRKTHAEDLLEIVNGLARWWRGR